MISSTSNPSIKKVKKLISSSKYRREMGLFVVEGIRSVMEVPADRIDSLFYLPEKLGNKVSIVENFSQIDRVEVSENVMDAISSTKNTQGIVALCKMAENPDFYPKKDDVVLVLDQINDPGNLGTIIRSSRAADVDYLVLLKGSVDIYNDKVIRSSMGGIFHQKIITGVDIDFVLDRISSPIYSAVLENAEVYYDVDLSGGACIVLGNEANGISKEVLEKVPQGIYIPMANACESLNLGVSASVLAFEIKRQHRN